MFALSGSSLAEMVDCCAALREVTGSAASIEDATQRVVRWLCVNLVDETGTPAVADAQVLDTSALVARLGEPSDGDEVQRIITELIGSLREPTATGCRSARVVHEGGSVIAFGDALLEDASFAILIRLREPVPVDADDVFAAIGLSARVALLPFAVQVQSERLQRTLAELEHSNSLNAAIIESALDGVITMDASGAIIDFNRAAAKMFDLARADVLGCPLGDVIVPERMRDAHRQALIDYLAFGRRSIVDRRVEVTALHGSGREFPVELSVVRVPGSEPAVFSGHVRDISQRVRHEQELLASRARLAHIAGTLQASLLPPVLPSVPNLDLAARYRPVTDGLDVGGDFYDAFEIAEGRWAFTLGDVCGKGADAAAITALARHTLRAAAIRNPEPSDVLSRLNDALHRQHPDKFCTAVYANVRTERGAVELALGGHPQPLLLRADGVVERVGSPGRLLGPFADWSGRTSWIDMHPGDLLLCYTDGVTEARRGLEQFGERRLMDVLSQLVALDVEAVIESVEAEVIAFAGEPTDDVAMLAFRFTG